MRIIAGTYGGRKLHPVPGNKTRPTTDKVRESIFNMIGPYFQGGNFLDLFAGSGAVALEALSRGMQAAVLVDRQFAAIKTIKQNATIITDQDQSVRVWKMPAEHALQKLAQAQERFDIIFLDPPYAQQQMVKQLAEITELQLLRPGGLVICETDRTAELGEIPDYDLVRQKDYGLTLVTIYRGKEPAA
ncbi:16S rRNA (guanine(966)-N(2))-methyltransferase RsmD [Fructilactobacillus hinvesii]|uniref:16S rRNA (Guanine(966)-N(2))-methyltransferase RsmD n=1 Tax=Fructilactobacillus hinvesii TaxID=2940300 RepID=A0ABY5BS40_9LACO|nr:16S rRNA (guanine(966)-N(2))-methyltransferase RsmD [Fructilactobacillus hinvesii]USS87288.1 16S rRNA (guanine(966)-N(2))-methyltransferase RsmD [Fructilactobacillus hinvesii]